jgi:hypothetical protein
MMRRPPDRLLDKAPAAAAATPPASPGKAGGNRTLKFVLGGIGIFLTLAVIGGLTEPEEGNDPAGNTPAESTDPYVKAGALFIRECGSYYDSGDIAGFNDCVERVTEEYGP